MDVQSPISMTACRVADYARKHWKSAACNGPGIPQPKREAIFAAADKMEASRTVQEYEAAKDELHRLGIFFPDDHVRAVAQAAVHHGE